MPIITSMELHYDPQTFVVFTANPPRPEPGPARRPIAPALAAVAVAGLAPRLLEALLGASRRPR